MPTEKGRAMSLISKALGFSGAVLVACTLMASGASADTFTSEPWSSTTLTGSQVGSNVFAVGSASVSCPVARFSGTIAESGAQSAVLHPEYEGKEGSSCEVSPIGSATVSTTGCDYAISGETAGGDAPVEVQCEAGHEITVNGPCVIHIASQSPAGGVSFTNGGEGSKSDITAKATVSGIHAVVTDSFACTLGGLNPGAYTNATYEGSITFTGYTDLSGTEGSQIGIAVDTT